MKRVRRNGMMPLKWIVDRFEAGEKFRWVPYMRRGVGVCRRLWIGKVLVRDNETEVWASGFEHEELDDQMLVSDNQSRRQKGC